PAVQQVVDFWKSLGAVPQPMSPEDHDRVMARTSHLPHIIASVLSTTVGRNADQAMLGMFCGPGFRDTTRVAEGAPQVWIDILRTNHRFILEELQAFKAELDQLCHFMDSGQSDQIRQFLETGRERRQRLVAQKTAEGTSKAS
ncbi:MAG: prephenate dehydrogenase, partial [Lentisphaerota bacterium]